jgi:hypothetical protein
MYTDPIIDEIRKYRDQYAARFNYDVKAMLDDIRRRQKESGRKTVSRPPKRIATVNDSAADRNS